MLRTFLYNDFMSKSFTEADLPAKHGSYVVRVYPATKGAEPVVIYTKDLETNHSVLTRVHSECLTGDVFGSLRCDCGEQLDLSLKLMSKEGGVLIYLRQEGRGIGLFDKIQSYKLQQNGHDTYDANVVLGHEPDERSYDDLQQIFEDLNISKVRLITNNPSKVEAVIQAGVEVTERIPISIEENQFNKTYLQTKKEKFNHLL